MVRAAQSDPVATHRCAGGGARGLQGAVREQASTISRSMLMLRGMARESETIFCGRGSKSQARYISSSAGQSGQLPKLSDRPLLHITGDLFYPRATSGRDTSQGFHLRFGSFRIAVISL